MADPGPSTPADLAARSRAIREQAGIGIRAMAREAGLSRGYLSRLEQDGRPGGPAAARWLAILAVLDSGGWSTWPGGDDLAATIRR